MKIKKVLFIDRDGTLIREPEDAQVDSLEKLELTPGVIPALLKLQQAGFRLVMVTNQDGLGTASFPELQFTGPHQALLKIFSSQGIAFDDVLICPHRPGDGCFCRKPHLGLVRKYLDEGELDRSRSFVIGDRASDMELARNMGITGLLFGEGEGKGGWAQIASDLTTMPRSAKVRRVTRETHIEVAVTLDVDGPIEVATGIGFLDHMIEQLAKHGGFALRLRVAGDLHIDEHHTVEDSALALGEALRKALGDKVGIGRYGFLLPMDEAEAQVSVDLSGRSLLVFEGAFSRESVGGLPTELVSHFFRSLADALGATLHLSLKGENAHHMIESAFKGTGRALRPALRLSDPGGLPSTKGLL